MEGNEIYLDQNTQNELNNIFNEISSSIINCEKLFDERNDITSDMVHSIRGMGLDLKGFIDGLEKNINENFLPDPDDDEQYQRYQPLPINNIRKINNLTKMKEQQNIYDKELISKAHLLKDGQRLIFGTKDGKIFLYKITSSSFERLDNFSIDSKENCEITSIFEVFNNNNPYTSFNDTIEVVISSNLPKVYVFKVSSKLQLINTFTEHKNLINSVIKLGSTYITSSVDCSVIIYNSYFTSIKKDTCDPIALLKVSDDLFCVSWKMSKGPQLHFYSLDGRERQFVSCNGCVTSSGLFLIEKTNGRNKHIVVGYDDEKDERDGKGKIMLIDCETKDIQSVIDNNRKIRCKDQVKFVLFGNKFLLYASLYQFLQIDIDNKCIVKDLNYKNDKKFVGIILGVLAGNEYILTDNEVPIYIEKKNKRDKTLSTRQGLTLMKIIY